MIWTVEDYYRAKRLYEENGALFNPSLIAGSPAEIHVRHQAMLRAQLAAGAKAAGAPSSLGDPKSEGKDGRTQGTAPAPATPTETVDAAGYVTNPKDPTAYVAAKDVLRDHTPAVLAITYKQFTAILKKHAEIRRWRPRANRLNIHLADWTAYVKGETGKLGDDGLLADELEIEARKDEIRRRKTPRK